MNHHELLEQVRAYSQALVEDLPEAKGDQVVAPLRRRRPPRTSAAWIGLSAAALVIVLVGVVPLLLNQIGLGANIDTYRWSRVSYDKAAFGEGFEQMIHGVTVGGPGLVAVGQAGAPVDGAAVWTSIDGFAWSRVPHDAAAFNRAVMRSVAVADFGLVAVGTAEHAPVWISPDGIAWFRVPHDPEAFGSEADYIEINSVAAFGTGVVAVGTFGDPQVGDMNGAVWTSSDGFNWSRIGDDESVFGKDTWMTDVAEGGPGLVAVGSDDTGAAVWTSHDGIIWSRVPSSSALRDGLMESVTSGGPGVVAVGTDDEGGAVWTSVDGTNWTRVTDNTGAFEGGEISSVTSVGAGLVAVGRKDRGAAAWTSTDGISWSQVPHDETIFETVDADLPDLLMSDAAAFGSRLVVVGANRWPDESLSLTKSEAAIWVATP